MLGNSSSCLSRSSQPHGRIRQVPSCHRWDFGLERFEDSRLLMRSSDKVVHVGDAVRLEKGRQVLERSRNGKGINVVDGSEGNGARSGSHELDDVAVVVHSTHSKYRNAHGT